PDPDIFTEERTFNFEMLEQRIRELAFLNKGLTMTIEDKRDDSEPISYYYEGGIRSYVKYINQTKGVLHEPFYIEGEDQGSEVETAVKYNDGDGRHIYSFANHIHTHEGGTQEVSSLTALTRAINAYARKYNMFKEYEPNLT